MVCASGHRANHMSFRVPHRIAEAGVPALPAAGVPLNSPDENESPFGRLPDSVIAGAGVPATVTAK